MTRTRRTPLTLLPIAGLLLGALGANSARAIAAQRGPKAGDPPPEITATAVDGRKVSLASLKGKVVVLDFWATWCGPCVDEMPAMRALQKRYEGRGLELVGISLDDPKDRDKIVAFTREQQLPWPQVHDTRSEFARAYGVASIPFTVLIGKDGRIVATKLRGKALASAVEAALK